MKVYRMDMGLGGYVYRVLAPNWRIAMRKIGAKLDKLDVQLPEGIKNFNMHTEIETFGHPEYISVGKGKREIKL